MNQLENVPFKDLAQMTIEVAEKFFYAKKMKAIYQGSYLAEFGFDEEISIDNYLAKVEKAYSVLNDLEKNLINNEFFYQSYNQWWKPLYSKASFYRYKKEAMQKFLEALYDL